MCSSTHCAMNSSSHGCLHDPTRCRSAVLDVLGTKLRTRCNCEGGNYKSHYMCLDWQRLLWLNPCVVQAQFDFHSKPTSTASKTDLARPAPSSVITAPVTTRHIWSEGSKPSSTPRPYFIQPKIITTTTTTRIPFYKRTTKKKKIVKTTTAVTHSTPSSKLVVHNDGHCTWKTSKNSEPIDPGTRFRLDKLEINKEKTKVMMVTNNKQQEDINIKLDGVGIQQVDKFQYLGVFIDNKLDHKIDVKCAVARAKDAFLRHKEFFKNNVFQDVKQRCSAMCSCNRQHQLICTVPNVCNAAKPCSTDSASYRLFLYTSYSEEDRNNINYHVDANKALVKFQAILNKHVQQHKCKLTIVKEVENTIIFQAYLSEDNSNNDKTHTASKIITLLRPSWTDLSNFQRGHIVGVQMGDVITEVVQMFNVS
ncbi:hypothetical protein GQR58_025935 [Nymphon striatum]|nr:hypothetical protein GQR58_025935 [Nymphon striatum]